MNVWVIVGALLLAPALAAVGYGMVKEPALRWAILLTVGLIGGATALTYGLSL